MTIKGRYGTGPGGEASAPPVVAGECASVEGEIVGLAEAEEAAGIELAGEVEGWAAA